MNGRHAGKHEVQQNERIGVKRFCREQRVDEHPQDQHAGEGKDERPAACEFRDGVRRALTEGVFFLFTCKIFGNLTVCQQVQHLFIRHVVADILEDFSQKLSVFFHIIILFYLTGAIMRRFYASFFGVRRKKSGPLLSNKMSDTPSSRSACRDGSSSGMRKSSCKRRMR